jgi:Protein of unknown function (DUF3592)
MAFATPELFVGAGFAAVGGAALVHGFVNLARAIDSEAWPSADGEILESRIATDDGGQGRLFYPAIRYRYRIGDHSYEGDRVSFGGPFEASWRAPAAHVVERYREGKAIRVRFSPTDPRVSVLEPGARWYMYVVILVGAVFLAIGLRRLMNVFGWSLPF